jgi:hypothetical protein
VSTYRYRIVIAGDLGRYAREAFAGFEIEFTGGRTVLTADLDEAALHGAFNRIQSLHLELVELTRLSE